MPAESRRLDSAVSDTGQTGLAVRCLAVSNDFLGNRLVHALALHHLTLNADDFHEPSTRIEGRAGQSPRLAAPRRS